MFIFDSYINPDSCFCYNGFNIIMRFVIRYFLIIWFMVLFAVSGFCFTGFQENDSLLENNNASYYDSLGIYYSRHDDNRKAISFFKNAVALKKAEFDSLGLASSYENMSRSYQLLKEYRKAISCQMLASRLKAEVLNPYYQQVRKLIPKANDSLNLMRLYYRFGLFISRKGRQKEATAYYQEALKMARAMHYDKAIATIANELGGEYMDLGKKQLSNLRYKEALAASIRLNDSNRMAAVYLNIGDNYKEQGNLEKGMEQMIKALRIKESLADSSRLSFYYVKAAEIAKVSLNMKKWEEYIRKAYNVKDLDHCALPMEKAIIYENLGSIAEYNNHFQKAFRYYDTLMDISRRIHYINGIKAALNSRAAIYRKLGQPDKALRLLLAAEKYITENPFNHISSRNAKAELYLETKNYKQALKLLQENIASPVLGNYADEKLSTLQMLYKVNTELANYKEAFRWNDSLRDFENFLRDKDVRTKIAELETKYQTEKNKHTISMLKAKNEIYDQQIRFAILLIIGLMVVIAFGIFVARMTRLKNEFRENKLQQQLLRSQMNPHFIFNALASIQQMIQNRKMKDAGFYLGRFASITRLVLEYSKEESIPLEKELEILQSYIELEKLRSGNHFEYKINFDKDLETEFIRIPPMAIQPFVENAIKHGLNEKEEGGLLKLSLEDMGDVLKVIIEDNGVGIEHARQSRKQHRSMAMEIFERRRQLMQRRYKKKLVIRFIDLSHEGKTGTRVIIHLPIL